MRRAIRSGIGGGPASCVIRGVKNEDVLRVVGEDSMGRVDGVGCSASAVVVGAEGCGCAVQHEGVLWMGGDLCFGQ
jgi:hypothetical protein